MDTIKVLLGVTVALLLGALVMSWKDFQRQERNTPKEELAEVRRQIGEIQLQQERLRLERERMMLGEAPAPAPEAPAAAASPEVAAAPAIEAPPAGVPMPDFADPSELDLAPSVPTENDTAKRAAAIKGAPVVAKIAEWIDNPEIGTFATLEIVDAASVQKGTMLHLRRNSGILGKLQVSEVTPEGALADAVSQFGAIKPEVGDELILEPVEK